VNTRILPALVLAAACATPPDDAPPPTAPTAPLIAIQPAAPTTVDALRVVVTTPSTDVDGDLAGYTFRWQRDGVDVAAPADPETLPSTATTRDETWTVWASARDTTGLSSSASFAEVVVANSPPTPPTVAVEPLEPTPDDALVCVLPSEGADADADLLEYTFAWTVDEQPFEGAETTTLAGDTVPGSATEPLQTWRCSASASDGTDASAAVFASVTIGEGDPRVPDFALVDVNSTSPTAGTEVSPRDYLQKVSGWYFGHST